MDDKAQRRQSRALAVESFFAYEAREEKVSLEESFQHVLELMTNRKDDAFARSLLEAATDNFGKIKVIIRSLAPDFTFDKIAPINRALLILGVAEMKFLDTPPVVVINEYIELAKDFGEEKSASFINGVLDNYRKSLGLERAKKED